MGVEIERKFLVKPGSEAWRLGLALRMSQGYISKSARSVVRVRVSSSDEQGERAWLTIKGATIGATRAEYEYEIPVEDARKMLDSLCDAVIDKTRYVSQFMEHTWEVDEFYGVNQGLIVAEIELGAEDEQFSLPDWIAEEVTSDDRYYNSNLSINPFTTWNQG